MRKSIAFTIFILFTSLFLVSNDMADKNNLNNKRLQKIFHILPHALDEMEDNSYATFLNKIFKKESKKQKPDLIIVEIDTPGGELKATFKIKNIILSSHVRTICFINKNAISAGSLIALSCNKTVMSKGSVIGAATPVFMTGKGMKKAPEKIVSVARAAWRSTAQANKKNQDIAEAFVDDSILLSKTKHGIYKKRGKLLTLTTQEALHLKMIDYTANSIQEILEKEKIEKFIIVELRPDATDKILAFFLSPVVSGILMGLGFLGLVYEIKVPGWGIPGSVGILFLSIYFVSRILIGTSGWGAPALFAFGIFLLLIEIFIIPGFGLAGGVGILLIFSSMLWSYGMNDLKEGLWVMAFALIGTIIMSAFLVKKIPQLAQRSSKIFLNKSLNSDQQNIETQESNLINKIAVVYSDLRPSGSIIIDKKRYDAVSLGDFIEKKTQVKILQIEGNKIIVEKT